MYFISKVSTKRSIPYARSVKISLFNLIYRPTVSFARDGPFIPFLSVIETTHI